MAGRLRGTALVLVTAALALTCCVGQGDGDGDDVAWDIAEKEAGRLRTEFGYSPGVAEAESVAAWHLPPEESDRGIPDELGGRGSSTTSRTPVGWSGRIFGDEQATIDVRFVVAVSKRTAWVFFDSDQVPGAGPAGRARRRQGHAGGGRGPG